MFKIICVTNRHICRGGLRERIEEIAEAGADAVILREKDMTEEDYRRLAREVMEVCGEKKTRCILHSFHKTAADLGCQALHMPLGALEALSEEQRSSFKILWASCHSREEAVRARDLGCTYITAGHIFNTDSKKGTPGRGLGFLRDICASVSIPVFAIGGISSGNVMQVREAGAAGACVMSGLMASSCPKEAVRRLRSSAEPPPAVF